MADVLGGIKARFRSYRHRGVAPWLVEPAAMVYARAQWARQRWLLRRYDRASWLRQRDDVDAVVDFAFEGFGGAFAPLQSPYELRELAELIRTRAPKVVLELGTARGGTFFVLTRMAAPDATIISIDLPSGIGGSGYPEWKSGILRSFATDRQTIHLVRADSHSPATVQQCRDVLGGRPVDVLFIDADHSYAGVRSDYELYAPLVHHDGLICMHDVVPNPFNDAIEVDRFWNEVADERARVIRDPAGLAGFGIGVLTP
jgi:predicted O-methyltransferase YrrM